MALDGNHGVQFWFRAGFQSEVEFASVRDDFLHHRLHLVYLNRIYYEVLGLVIIFFRGFHKAACSLLDTVVENVGKAQQYRRSNITQREFIHHVAQINLRVVLAWRYIHIAFVVNAEVGCSPTVNVVEFL